MQIKDALKWNNRVSAIYALGVWTMLCSVGYMKYTGQLDQALQKAKEEEDEESENKVVYKTAYTKSTIIYKKDFVPYTTRIYNFLRPSSAEPSKTEGDAARPDEAANSSSKF
ncbi:unnamed protein product [Ophioblennius macclurei]